MSKFFRSPRLTVLATAFLTVLGTLSSPASAAPAVTISQGQQVLVPDQGICTVGYVDKVSHRAYLADHCVNDKGQRTQPVTVHDLNTGEPLGTTTPIGKMGMDGGGSPMQDPRFDVNYIQLADHVAVGTNRFSGDSRVDAYDIEQNDEVCVYSSRRDKTYCGYAWSTVGSVIKVHIPGGEADKAVTFGDSGGPAWIPGKGFAGVLVSMGGKTIWYTSIDTRDCTTEQVVDRADPEGFGQRTCPQGSEHADVSPHNYVGRTSTPAPHTKPSPSVPSNPSPSAPSNGSSAGGVVAVIAAVIAALLGLASLVGLPGMRI